MLEELIKRGCAEINNPDSIKMIDLLLRAAYIVKKKWLNKLKQADIKIYLCNQGLKIGTTYKANLNSIYNSDSFKRKSELLIKAYPFPMTEWCEKWDNIGE